MYIYKILIVLMFLLSGCAQHGYLVTDTDFKPFIEMFEGDYGYSTHVPVVFYPQTGNLIGVCYIYRSGFKKIEIDPMFGVGLHIFKKKLLYIMSWGIVF